MSGVFTKKFGRKNWGRSERTSCVMYSISSAFVFFQVKYLKDWLKPALASVAIIFGWVQASRRKTRAGGALDCEVERELDPELTCPLDEALEVLERAQVRMDRGVPALRPADRPRAARIARPGLERVVLALPVRAADRVDRGEVDDVE